MTIEKENVEFTLLNLCRCMFIFILVTFGFFMVINMEETINAKEKFNIILNIVLIYLVYFSNNIFNLNKVLWYILGNEKLYMKCFKVF